MLGIVAKLCLTNQNQTMLYQQKHWNCYFISSDAKHPRLYQDVDPVPINRVMALLAKVGGACQGLAREIDSQPWGIFLLNENYSLLTFIFLPLFKLLYVPIARFSKK